MNENEIAFKGEVWLLSWRESHNNGATVTFQLADSDELQPFKAMTVKKGRRAGQRFACVLVEVGEDEQPVRQKVHYSEVRGILKDDKPKGGELSKLAAMWCQDPRFWKWAEDTFKTPVLQEAHAKLLMLKACGIESRAELDHDEGAERIFHEKFRIPFSKYLTGFTK